MLSLTEENYLKAIYHLSEDGTREVLTNEIAEVINTKAASVTDMIKKLSAKGVIEYEKYHGVRITKQGKHDALMVIRKHRLWETFLVDKLGFSWDEVHEIAEQLEHIQSPILIEKLDAFLGYPKTDPHGEPIPDKKGKITVPECTSLDQLTPGTKGTIASVKDSDANLLKYLDRIGALPGKKLILITKEEYDGSLVIEMEKKRISISKAVSENILIAV